MRSFSETVLISIFLVMKVFLFKVSFMLFTDRYKKSVFYLWSAFLLLISIWKINYHWKCNKIYSIFQILFYNLQLFLIFLGGDSRQWCCGQIINDPKILQRDLHKRLQKNHRRWLSRKGNWVSFLTSFFWNELTPKRL